MEPGTQFTILLAEDDENHVLIIQKAFDQIPGLTYEMKVIYDGETLLERLRLLTEPLPDLLLLDLKIPRADGFEILKEIRASHHLQHLPVVVFTSSSRASDVRKCYELGCNSYIVKPMKFEKFKEIMFHLYKYWFEINTLPNHAETFEN
jgi:CheY-like chemotaxis protein